MIKDMSGMAPAEAYEMGRADERLDLGIPNPSGIRELVRLAKACRSLVEWSEVGFPGCDVEVEAHKALRACGIEP